MRFLRQPDTATRLGDFLKVQLAAQRWREFRAAVAFTKRSGVQYLADELATFASRGSVRISVGVDLHGTSKDGLQALLDAVTANGGEVWIFHNADPFRPTFHPKVYLFKKPDAALLIIGSGNLTAGGLFTNYEANAVFEIDLKDKADAALLREVEAALDAWSDPTHRLARVLTPELLQDLERHGLVQPESRARGDEVSESERGEIRQRDLDLFGQVRIPRPALPARPTIRGREPRVAPASGRGHRGFLMTLQRTDVGTGQTTPGTSRRSPEIFIPLAARDEDPDFWGWPDQFREDPARRGKRDRMGVRMRIGGDVVRVNMMTWPVKHDLRLRSEAIRSAGHMGDILRIERAPAGSGFEYYVEIVPQGTTEHARRLAQCIRPVRNSRKRYGYY
ncbi:MAG: phospholipase D family protein [Deltaproteobacteria bacterium]|nr:phospholipase D family protein [Deltaproteobacteria bacterium]